MEKLIRLKDRDHVKDALAFTELQQKYKEDKRWSCQSCNGNLLCCYQMRDLVDQTVRVRHREDTEGERPKQRARVEIEEVADEDLEDLIQVYGEKEAIMPTQP